jgi:hypothetical protein
MIKDWRAKFSKASKGTTDLSFPFGFVQVIHFYFHIRRFSLFNVQPVLPKATASYLSQSVILEFCPYWMKIFK